MTLREAIYEVRQVLAAMDAARARGDCVICDHVDHVEACPGCDCPYEDTLEGSVRRLNLASAALGDALLEPFRRLVARLCGTTGGTDSTDDSIPTAK